MELQIKKKPGQVKEKKGTILLPYSEGLILQIVSLTQYPSLLSSRWKGPASAWKLAKHTAGADFKLGSVIFTYIDPSFEVADVIGFNEEIDGKDVHYEKIREGLKKVAQYAKDNKFKHIHMMKPVDITLCRTILDGLVSEGQDVIFYS